MTPKNFFIAILLGVALAAGIFVASNLNRPAEVQKAFVIPQPSEGAKGVRHPAAERTA
jgi:hypothetical protein